MINFVIPPLINQTLGAFFYYCSSHQSRDDTTTEAFLEKKSRNQNLWKENTLTPIVCA